MMNGSGGGGMGWYGPVIGLLVTVGFFGLIAWAVVALTRRNDQPAAAGSATAPAPVQPGPDEVLAERFARGEIDVDEFEQRRAALRAQ